MLLSAAELLSICSLLEAAKRVKAFSRSEKEEVPDDSLTGFFTEIEPLTPLYDEIKRCILAEDEIATTQAAHCVPSAVPCAA